MQILVRLEAKDGWVMPQTRRGGGRRKPSALKHMDSEHLTTLSVEVAKFWHSAYDELVRMEEQLLGQLEEMLPKLSRAARREAELTNLPMINEHLQMFKYRRADWQEHPAALNRQATRRPKPTAWPRIKRRQRASRPTPPPPAPPLPPPPPPPSLPR